jgi:hypothetical protein
MHTNKNFHNPNPPACGRSFKLLLFVVSLGLALPSSAGGLLDLVNALPGNLKNGLPSLPTAFSLPKDPDGISTSLLQAYRSDSFLDGYTPHAREAAAAQMDESGLTVTTGFYNIRVQSYCLHAGTYRPKSSGNGYVLAPLQGPKAEVIKHILTKSYTATDLNQQDIQSLIWAILSGAKFSKLSRTDREVARRFLSVQEIEKLDSGVLGPIPDEITNEILSRANSRIPESYKRVAQSYSALKRKFESASASFEELERIAAPEAPPEMNSGDVIKPGQWTLREGEYFMRVMPSGYRETRIQIYRPLKSTVTYDSYGRVAEIDFNDGYKTKSEYADQIREFVDPATGRKFSYSVAEKIRFEGPFGSQIVNTRPVIVFHAKDFLHPRFAVVNWDIPLISRAVAQESGGGPSLVERFQQAYNSFKTWKGLADAARKYEEETQRDGQPVSQKDEDAFLSEKFYNDGVNAALNIADLNGKAQWTREYLQRMSREVALLSCRLAGGCSSNDPGSNKHINLPNESPVPGSYGFQRLALSSRVIR